MTLRDLDIDIDIDIDASDLVSANAQVDRLVRSINEIDDRIKMQIDFNDNGIIAELQRIEQLARDLDNTLIHIDVSMDNISAEIAAMNTQLQTVDDNIKIDVDFARIIAATTAVNDLVEAIRRIDRNIKIDVDMDISDVLRDVSLMRAQLATIRRHNIDVDVDTVGAMAQIAALQAQLSALQASTRINIGGIGGMGAGLNPLMMIGKIAAVAIILPMIASAAQVAVGAIGTLGVAIGVLAGGLLSLVSATGIAAIGLGGFAVLGVSAIAALYDENAKLTAAQKELKKHTDSVIDSWKGLQKTLEPFTFSAIESGVGIVNQLLGRAEPILQNATIAVDGLFDSLGRSLNNDNMTAFFSYLERAIGPITTNIGNGLGNALQGVLNTMTALEPLTSWVAQGFENMTGRFADWTGGLKDSDKLKEFMQYAQENIPKIGSIVKDATGGITSFFAAFDVTAADGLTWMSDKMKEFAEWAGKLDENEGFQNMLDRIKKDGPEVAKLIGTIAKDILAITNFVAGIGRNDDGSNEILGFHSKLAAGHSPTIIDEAKMAWSVVKSLNPFGGKDEAAKVTVDVAADTTQYTQQVSNLAATPPTVNVPTVAKIDPMTFRPGFIAPVNIPATAQVDKIETTTQVGPTIKAAAQISSIDMSQVGPVKMPAQMTMGNSNGFVWPPMPQFTWPPLPTFVWPVLPTFTWPQMPRFSWPAYPRFTWPPIPTVRVQVDGGTPNLPGFSTGLGRVSVPEAPVIVHQDEAIIQASGANQLRQAGILQGDGRNPTINTSAVSTTTTSSENNTSQAVQVDVGGIQITVQGGNTNEETATNLEEKLEDFFARMGFAMFQAREG